MFNDVQWCPLNFIINYDNQWTSMKIMVSCEASSKTAPVLEALPLINKYRISTQNTTEYLIN